MREEKDMMTGPTVSGIYTNGTIRFPSTVIRLKRRLPMPNQTRIRFTVTLFPPRDAEQTAGILRVPKRIAKLVAESPDFSTCNV